MSQVSVLLRLHRGHRGLFGVAEQSCPYEGCLVYNGNVILNIERY
jgi:hypothetical protein